MKLGLTRLALRVVGGAVAITNHLLLVGDMQSGTIDALLLEGDMQSGTDDLAFEGAF